MYTDDDILHMNKVPPKIAAEYLGCSLGLLTVKLREGVLPFALAGKQSDGAWTYHILPEPLVQYKHYGTLPVVLSEDKKVI